MFVPGEEVEYRLNAAALYPVLGAFRAFVERAEDGTFRWIGGDVERVKAFWNEIVVEVLETTKESLADKGYALNALGKSRSHWTNIQRIVENALLRNQIDAA